MAVEVTGDERDRKRAGAVKEASALKYRAERGDAAAAKALQARVIELDQTVLQNPDPAKVYRMASNDKKGRVGQLKGMGYSVTALDSKTQAVSGYENEGAQTVGSMILMETSRENYEKRRRDKRLIYEMQTGSVTSKARENINKIAADGGFIKAGEDITVDESGKA